MTTRAAFFCAVLGAFVSCCATARAETEFCPGKVAAIEASAGAGVPSTEFSYVLDAKSARTLDDAAIVADTDHGWYRWSIANVPLQMTSQAASHRGPAGMVNYTYKFAQSTRQLVAFPEALLVRHAWITSARSDDENVFGWGKRGEFACEVPTFPNRGIDTAELARPQSRKATPLPLLRDPRFQHSRTARRVRCRRRYRSTASIATRRSARFALPTPSHPTIRRCCAETCPSRRRCWST